jgi:hypothetical protein
MIIRPWLAFLVSAAATATVGVAQQARQQSTACEDDAHWPPRAASEIARQALLRQPCRNQTSALCAVLDAVPSVGVALGTEASACEHELRALLRHRHRIIQPAAAAAFAGSGEASYESEATVLVHAPRSALALAALAAVAPKTGTTGGLPRRPAGKLHLVLLQAASSILRTEESLQDGAPTPGLDALVVLAVKKEGGRGSHTAGLACLFVSYETRRWAALR